jgi:PAS domain S-box-containing protein
MNKGLVIGRDPDDHTLARLYRLQIRDLETVTMFVTDSQGTIQTWNRAVGLTFGYSEEEWIGLHAEIIFTEEDRRAAVPDAEMKAASENGSASNIRWHVRKDGIKLYTVGVLKCLRDDDGSILGYTKIIIDDTGESGLRMH